MFETRSHSWQEVGLARQLSRAAVKRARIETLLLVPTLVGVVLAYSYRRQLFGLDLPVRIITVVVLLVLGWALARNVGRAAAPSLFRRLDPGTAGTVGFLIRLVTIGVALLAALRIGGLDPRTLTIGGAFTAVVSGWRPSIRSATSSPGRSCSAPVPSGSATGFAFRAGVWRGRSRAS